VLADGVIVADDLMLWVAALRLTAALVTRQHFLPDVIEDNGKYIARWRPVPSNEEARAMVQLAAAMPDVCRAFQDRVSLPRSSSRRRATDAVPAHNGREMRSPLAVLSEFIAGAVDQLVRSAAMPQPASLESIDERWLAALSQPDGNLEADRAELEQLKQRVQDWWRPFALHASSPFRLCFRLEEPAPPISPGPSLATANGGTHERRKVGILSPDGAWRLAYLLQAHHDPSLMLPASEAWSVPQQTARLVRRSGFDIREYLLHAFGEAARLYPLVGESLRVRCPQGSTSMLLAPSRS
jgi:hypothetical protein